MSTTTFGNTWSTWGSYCYCYNWQSCLNKWITNCVREQHITCHHCDVEHHRMSLLTIDVICKVLSLFWKFPKDGMFMNLLSITPCQIKDSSPVLFCKLPTDSPPPFRSQSNNPQMQFLKDHGIRDAKRPLLWRWCAQFPPKNAPKIVIFYWRILKRWIPLPHSQGHIPMLSHIPIFWGGDIFSRLSDISNPHDLDFTILGTRDSVIKNHWCYDKLRLGIDFFATVWSMFWETYMHKSNFLKQLPSPQKV